MRIINNSSTRLTFLIAVSITMAACASTDPTRVEDDFGNSVRHMVQSQIYDKEAANNPARKPPMGIDGVQAESVLDVYREHVGNPKKVSDSLRIDISE